MRLRRAVALGALLWILFGAVDWLMSRTSYPGPVAPVLGLRLLVTPGHLLFLWCLYRMPTLTVRALAVFDILGFSLSAASLALISARMGGIAGPYTPGMFLILICRSAFLIQPWRQAAAPNALIVLTHFAVLMGYEYLVPGAIFTLGPENSAAMMSLHFGSIAAGAVFLTVASHTTWALRQRIFEMRNLGRYRLIERIGAGGYGEVWRASQARGKADVAVKVLRNEVAEDDRALARFEREVDALSRLSHPNTIHIFDHGVTPDGVGYYVMELLKGRTLSELVSAEGPMSPQRAIHLIQQTALALAEAHAQNIVHRDIKPENIFVLALDAIKLLDFGMAKPSPGPGTPAPALTRSGMVIGTPGFMAPEVANGQAADYRSDVYGLGAVVYFLLTGHVPESQSVHTRRQATPRHTPLDRILLRCLSFEPQLRYANAAELSHELASLDIFETALFKPSVSAISQVTKDLPTRTGPSSDRA